MLRFASLTLAFTLVVVGCQSVRNQNRFQMSSDPSRPLVASRYEPESDYQCREVGTHTCPYFNSPFEDPIKACAKHAAADANAASANYVYVDLPHTAGAPGVLGTVPVKMGATRAHLLQCASLPVFD